MRSGLFMLALALVLSGCAHLQLVPRPKEAEAFRARTADGWEISLTRYKARGPVKGPPVLLCHGISANDRNMDLDDELSMARWFASQGREAWTMSLRGTGESDGVDAAKGREPISFDDYWRQDLPAAIEFVRKSSGAEAIDYVGHSMGGMALYAYLGQGGQGVRMAATLGSPTRLDWGSSLGLLVRTVGPVVASKPASLPSAFGAKLAAPFQGIVPDGVFQRIFYNPQSTDPAAFQRLMVYGVADTAGGTALQLITLMETGRFLSADGKIDLKAGMATIRTPILVVAGRLDRIGVVPAVKDGYRALGGPKKWLVITRANGAKGEYGHMDLVIGKRAADEVWSKVLGYFDSSSEQAPR
jgi:poly(3-hydroxyalkanoate) synthetase